MNDLAWIGPAMLQRRFELGLTQTALAGLAGLSRATVNALERGKVADLSVGRLGRLLQVLGTRLQLAKPPAPRSLKANQACIASLAQSASVSYRTLLPGRVLALALASGELPQQYLAHISTLLDEAPLPMVTAAVEAISRSAKLPPAQVWKHLGAWARELKSPREAWRGL